MQFIVRFQATSQINFVVLSTFVKQLLCATRARQKGIKTFPFILFQFYIEISTLYWFKFNYD
jgi:hypothetical protein